MSFSVKYLLQSESNAFHIRLSLFSANSNRSGFLLFLSLIVFSWESLSYRLFNSRYVFLLIYYLIKFLVACLFQHLDGHINCNAENGWRKRHTNVLTSPPFLHVAEYSNHSSPHTFFLFSHDTICLSLSMLWNLEHPWHLALPTLISPL